MCICNNNLLFFDIIQFKYRQYKMLIRDGFLLLI